MFNPQDFYFNKAKKQGYKARSAFKLEEINKKFNIFQNQKNNILDIGCAPWSWLQYISKVVWKNSKIIWIDLKETNLNLPNVKTYVQDATKIDELEKSKIKNETFTYLKYYYMYPLFLALIALMLYVYLRNRRGF